MARMARLVLPGSPHHVTQRGNRRLEVFFRDEDYQAYLDLLAEWADLAGTRVWAYCLMPNHIHLILNPGTVYSFLPLCLFPWPSRRAGADRAA